MQFQRHLSDFAALLAKQTWVWDCQGLAATFLSLGWNKEQSVGHRNSYRICENLRANVYHDDDVPIQIEINVAVSSDPDLLEDLEYAEMKNEFKTDLLIGTEQISSGIGQPAFSGGPATSGFPDDQDANALSLWNLPNARLMLQLTHQDRELPFIICLVVAPRDD